MSFSSNEPIEFKCKFKKIKDYSFINILSQSDLTKNENIFQIIKESNFLMINQYVEQNENEIDNFHTYIVIVFKKTIINIEKSIFSMLQPLLSFNPDIYICFLSKINDININIDNKSWIIDSNDDFKTEIRNFNKELFLCKPCEGEINKIWQFISPCISGYLINENYKKIKVNRLDNFINFEKQKEAISKLSTELSENFSPDTIPIIKEDEFIELRDIEFGIEFKAVLIFFIEKEILYVLKKQNDGKLSYLLEQEIYYYPKIQHPFIPKLIGIGQNNEYLIIEFINCQSVSDIYSLQLILSEIKKDIAKCINKKEIEMPTTLERIFKFFPYYEDIQISDLFETYIMNFTEGNKNLLKILSFVGYLFAKGELVTRDIDKSIHYYTLAANQNHADAQFNLGLIYEKSKLVPQDINISIHYYTLAANQNHAEAQFNLGLIYEKGELVPQDINKGIHYYTLAANQNHADAQFNLGLIYGKGELVPQDIDKSIHYYTLAANQNHTEAQFNLGLIYGKGELVPQDISKGIHYCTLAANQNHADAQFIIGLLYGKSKLVPQDIDKSIHYYTLAANQNHTEAQFNLGLIYEKSKLVPQDINESIHYYTLAANQNHAGAQFHLSYIYFYKIKSYKFKKIVEYLVRISDQIKQSKNLLSLVLVKQYKTVIFETIKNDIMSANCKNNNEKIQLAVDIYQIIKTNDLEDHVNYEYECKKK